MTHEWQPLAGQKKLLDQPKLSRAVKNELSLGLRDSFAILQANHKRKQIRSGGGNRRAVSGRWTTRTGNLARRFTIIQQKGSLTGSYGSNLKRAGALERGATIRPKKGKYLAIPMPHLRVGVGAAPGPRDFNGLFFIRSKRGNLLLVRKQGQSGLQVMFVLKEEIRLKKRPTLEKAVKATDRKRTVRMQQAVAKAVNSNG